MKKTHAERQAARLRDKCQSGPDDCGAMLAGILGGDTPPLTDRQRDRVLRAATLHFAGSMNCDKCPQGLADACELAPELIEMVRRRENMTRPKGKAGIVSVIARGVIASRGSDKGDPAPPPVCAGCGVEMHPFAAEPNPLAIEDGAILCFVCVQTWHKRKA